MISLRDVSQLPEVSAVYRVVSDGQVVYVGQAINLNKRWKSHHKAVELSLMPSVYIEWNECPPENLTEEESKAFVSLSPRLNQKAPSGKHVFEMSEKQEIDFVSSGFVTLSCGKCGHSWVPRSPKPPKVCSKCKRAEWNIVSEKAGK